MAALAGKVGAIEKRLDGINFAHEEASSAAAQQAALAGYAAKLRRQRWVSLRHPRRLSRQKGGFRRNSGLPPGPPTLSHTRGWCETSQGARREDAQPRSPAAMRRKPPRDRWRRWCRARAEATVVAAGSGRHCREAAEGALRQRSALAFQLTGLGYIHHTLRHRCRNHTHQRHKQRCRRTSAARGQLERVKEVRGHFRDDARCREDLGTARAL